MITIVFIDDLKKKIMTPCYTLKPYQDSNKLQNGNPSKSIRPDELANYPKKVPVGSIANVTNINTSLASVVSNLKSHPTQVGFAENVPNNIGNQALAVSNIKIPSTSTGLAANVKNTIISQPLVVPNIKIRHTAVNITNINTSQPLAVSNVKIRPTPPVIATSNVRNLSTSQHSMSTTMSSIKIGNIVYQLALPLNSKFSPATVSQTGLQQKQLPRLAPITIPSMIHPGSKLIHKQHSLKPKLQEQQQPRLLYMQQNNSPASIINRSMTGQLFSTALATPAPAARIIGVSSLMPTVGPNQKLIKLVPATVTPQQINVSKSHQRAAINIKNQAVSSANNISAQQISQHLSETTNSSTKVVGLKQLVQNCAPSANTPIISNVHSVLNKEIIQQDCIDISVFRKQSVNRSPLQISSKEHQNISRNNTKTLKGADDWANIFGLGKSDSTTSTKLSELRYSNDVHANFVPDSKDKKFLKILGMECCMDELQSAYFNINKSSTQEDMIRTFKKRKKDNLKRRKPCSDDYIEESIHIVMNNGEKRGTSCQNKKPKTSSGNSSLKSQFDIANVPKEQNIKSNALEEEDVGVSSLQPNVETGNDTNVGVSSLGTEVEIGKDTVVSFDSLQPEKTLHNHSSSEVVPQTESNIKLNVPSPVGAILFPPPKDIDSSYNYSRKNKSDNDVIISSESEDSLVDKSYHHGNNMSTNPSCITTAERPQDPDHLNSEKKKDPNCLSIDDSENQNRSTGDPRDPNLLSEDDSKSNDDLQDPNHLNISDSQDSNQLSLDSSQDPYFSSTDKSQDSNYLSIDDSQYSNRLDIEGTQDPNSLSIDNSQDSNQLSIDDNSNKINRYAHHPNHLIRNEDRKGDIKYQVVENDVITLSEYLSSSCSALSLTPSPSKRKRNKFVQPLVENCRDILPKKGN